MALRVGIIGGSGYTGAELMRLASGHPEMKVGYVTANLYADTRVDVLYPNLTGIIDGDFKPYSLEEAKDNDVLFLALPHGKAMETAPELIEAGCKVIDLSADYRLDDADTYEAWYKKPHANPELLDNAVYGLPELYADKIKGATFVSNPGCYVTGAILAMAPLLMSKTIDTDGIVINSLSGVSGAGRDAKPETHFCKVDENLTAYKVGGAHQHIPEIEQYLSDVAGEEITLSFTPHLMPINRGILTTAYADLATSADESDLIDLFADFYEGKPFVKVLSKGQMPQTKSVLGSNYCHVGLAVDGRTGPN
ncbi:MAG: N-acetyl-gamma-glutamyl-phosphate reductase, partial [Rubrobacteridae bacterium]|nr:N-acetyl-gamma-glutamyl-phosphate reductase [Rubrobacteridae bacterium]